MPNVPADLNLIIYRLHRSVYLAVNFLLAFRPEFFPCEYLRVIQNQSPERYEIPITWSLISPSRAHKLIKLDEALQCAIDINALLPSSDAAMFAKTRDLSTTIESAVTG